MASGDGFGRESHFREPPLVPVPEWYGVAVVFCIAVPRRSQSSHVCDSLSFDSSNIRSRFFRTHQLSLEYTNVLIVAFSSQRPQLYMRLRGSVGAGDGSRSWRRQHWVDPRRTMLALRYRVLLVPAWDPWRHSGGILSVLACTLHLDQHSA